MKRIQRWYEKNEFLKAFMKFLSKLKPEAQCEIAVDMILKTSEVNDRDYTKMIQEVAFHNPRNYKRWYDRNPNVHLAIESLRDLDESQIEEIIQEYCEQIISLNGIDIKEIE